MKQKTMIIAVMLTICICGTAAIFCQKSPGRRFRTAFQSAEKYLTEMKYEEAILEFWKAWEIQPREEIERQIIKAYSERARSSREEGEYDLAYDQLLEAWEETHILHNQSMRTGLLDETFILAQVFAENGNDNMSMEFLSFVKEFLEDGEDTDDLQADFLEQYLNYLKKRIEILLAENNLDEAIELQKEYLKYVKDETERQKAEVELTRTVKEAEKKADEKNKAEERKAQEAEEKEKQKETDLINQYRQAFPDNGNENLVIRDAIVDQEGKGLEAGVHEVDSQYFKRIEDKDEGKKEYYWYSLDNKGGEYEYHYYSVDTVSKTIQLIYIQKGFLDGGTNEGTEVNGPVVSYKTMFEKTSIEEEAALMMVRLQTAVKEEKNVAFDSENIYVYAQDRYGGNTALGIWEGPSEFGYGELRWIASCMGPDKHFYQFILLYSQETGGMEWACVEAKGDIFKTGERFTTDLDMSEELKEEREEIINAFRKAVLEKTGNTLSNAKVTARFDYNRWNINCIMDTGADFQYRGLIENGHFRATWEGSTYNGDTVNRDLFENVKELETDIES